MINAEQLAVIKAMMHGEIKNYVWPGFSSHLVGGKDQGIVRLFENTREQHADITPHSHRFDFTCLVLKGWVVNREWFLTDVDENALGDLYMSSVLFYEGDPGEYTRGVGELRRWAYEDRTYHNGKFYSMDAESVHSIKFSKDALVLFFEGPTRCDSSMILEPWVDGSTIPTFQVEEWMFKKTL